MYAITVVSNSNAIAKDHVFLIENNGEEKICLSLFLLAQPVILKHQRFLQSLLNDYSIFTKKCYRHSGYVH